MKVLVHASLYLAMTAEVDTEAGTLTYRSEPVCAGSPHAHVMGIFSPDDEAKIKAASNEAVSAVYEQLTKLWQQVRERKGMTPTQGPAGGMVQ